MDVGMVYHEHSEYCNNLFYNLSMCQCLLVFVYLSTFLHSLFQATDVHIRCLCYALLIGSSFPVSISQFSSLFRTCDSQEVAAALWPRWPLGRCQGLPESQSVCAGCGRWATSKSEKGHQHRQNKEPIKVVETSTHMLYIRTYFIASSAVCARIDY